MSRPTKRPAEVSPISRTPPNGGPHPDPSLPPVPAPYAAQLSDSRREALILKAQVDAAKAQLETAEARLELARERLRMAEERHKMRADEYNRVGLAALAACGLDPSVHNVVTGDEGAVFVPSSEVPRR